MTTPVPTVVPGSFLTLHYRLAGPDGADLVNTFNDKPATLSLGTGDGLALACQPQGAGLLLGLHVLGFQFLPGQVTEAVFADLADKSGGVAHAPRPHRQVSGTAAAGKFHAPGGVAARKQQGVGLGEHVPGEVAQRHQQSRGRGVCHAWGTG